MTQDIGTDPRLVGSLTSLDSFPIARQCDLLALKERQTESAVETHMYYGKVLVRGTIWLDLKSEFEFSVFQRIM